MTSLRALSVLAAAVLLLTGCTPMGDPPVPEPTALAEDTATPTPTPEVPEPAAIILSVDGLTVVDAAGLPLSSVLFSEAELTLELVTELEGGPAPVQDDSQYGTRYEWADATVGVLFGSVWFDSTSATVGGLPLRTSQGIQVGSTRADVLALDPLDIPYDSDGDGLSDSLGLEAQVAPGTESLQTPGQEGVSFIETFFTGDVVTRIGFGTDWFDI